MPALSKHYALLDFDPGNTASVPVEPISVDVTANEAWSPYIQATVVVQTSSMPYSPDPRFPLFMGLRLQQDFGDLLYVHELTDDYTPVTMSSITAAYTPVTVAKITRTYTAPWNIFETGLPMSTVTTAYTPVTPLKLTNAGLANVWSMSDFLHSSGTFNPQDSTIFDGYLMLRSIVRDYVTGTSTLELTSHEAMLIDTIGYADTTPVSFTSLRSIINFVLDISIGGWAQLEPGAADRTYSPAYGLLWKPEQTGWDILDALVKQANLVLYCDEAGAWHLNTAGSTTGDLYLKDDDNLTTLSSRIDRNDQNFFDLARIEYRYQDGTPSIYDAYGASGFDISKDRYFLLQDIPYPGSGAALAMVQRAQTRGEILATEAISNYDARPRQTMTIDVTGEPVKTAIVQSVTWSLPSARMSVDIRNVQEVI
jgi:hypothetical protein